MFVLDWRVCVFRSEYSGCSCCKMTYNDFRINTLCLFCPQLKHEKDEIKMEAEKEMSSSKKLVWPVCCFHNQN